MNSSEIPVREKNIVFLNYWNNLFYCHREIIWYLKPWLFWWEKFPTQIRPGARQLVTKVQAHPHSPDKSGNRQALAISFCAVSKCFLQAILFPLQVCPCGSSARVSYMLFLLSADTLSSVSSMHSLQNNPHVTYLYISYMKTSQGLCMV